METIDYYLKEDFKLIKYLREDYESLMIPSIQIPGEQLTKLINQDPNCIIIKKEKTNICEIKLPEWGVLAVQEPIKAQKMNVKDYVHHIKTNENIYGKLTQHQTDILRRSADLCEETLPNHSIPDFGSYALQRNSKIPEQIIILASCIASTGLHLRIAKNNPEKEDIGVQAVNHFLQHIENILTEYKN